MYKFVALFALVACAVAAPAPGGFVATSGVYHAAPYVAAPVAVAHSVPVATSYANTYKVDHKSSIVAPSLAYAAPVAVSHAAPTYYAAQPAALTYAAHAAPFAYLH